MLRFGVNIKVAMGFYTPNIGSVKIAEKIEHPGTWKNAPIKFTLESLLFWRAIDPLSGDLLRLGSISSISTLVIDMAVVGLDRQCSSGRMLHTLDCVDVLFSRFRHIVWSNQHQRSTWGGRKM